MREANRNNQGARDQSNRDRGNQQGNNDRNNNDRSGNDRNGGHINDKQQANRPTLDTTGAGERREGN